MPGEMNWVTASTGIQMVLHILQWLHDICLSEGDLRVFFHNERSFNFVSCSICSSGLRSIWLSNPLATICSFLSLRHKQQFAIIYLHIWTSIAEMETIGLTSTGALPCSSRDCERSCNNRMTSKSILHQLALITFRFSDLIPVLENRIILYSYQEKGIKGKKRKVCIR